MRAERSLAEWVDASLATFAAPHTGLLAEALVGVDVDLVVDDEQVRIGVRDGAVRRTIETGGACVRIRTTRKVLRELFQGQRGALAAVQADVLEVYGAPAPLLRAQDAGQVWLQAMVRGPDSEALLWRFLGRGEMVGSGGRDE